MQKQNITDFQTLKNYGYHYYLAYIPSIKKLEEKLKEKCWDEERVKKVLEDLTTHVDEEKNIHNYIRYYKEKNKNISYIRQKLTQKKFQKDDIQRTLQEDIESKWESILNAEYIKKKISDLKEKGKSKNAIRQKLIERKEDREVVEQSLEAIFWEDEIVSLNTTLKKLLKWRETEKLKKEEKGKIIQKLLMRWFEYDEIKRLFQ